MPPTFSHKPDELYVAHRCVMVRQLVTGSVSDCVVCTMGLAAFQVCASWAWIRCSRKSD